MLGALLFGTVESGHRGGFQSHKASIASSSMRVFVCRWKDLTWWSFEPPVLQTRPAIVGFFKADLCDCSVGDPGCAFIVIPAQVRIFDAFRPLLKAVPKGSRSYGGRPMGGGPILFEPGEPQGGLVKSISWDYHWWLPSGAPTDRDYIERALELRQQVRRTRLF